MQDLSAKIHYRFDDEKKKSVFAYSLLLLLSVVTVVWGQQLSQQLTNIRVWHLESWLVLLIGLPFILLQREAGFPELLQSSITARDRYWIPLFIGLFFGALDILVIKVWMHPEPYQSLPPFLQPFPYSLFLYTSGAFEVEIFYRLIPLTLALLVVGRWVMKGRKSILVFWVIAVLTSLRESIEQWPSGSIGFVLYSLASGILFNFLQALYFKKAGFLASLTIRLGHYLLWHILLGIYVEYFELAKPG